MESSTYIRLRTTDVIGEMYDKTFVVGVHWSLRRHDLAKYRKKYIFYLESHFKQ